MTDGDEEQKIKYDKQPKGIHRKNADISDNLDNSDNSENVEKIQWHEGFWAATELEFRQNRDGLNIDDYYKTMAYACLYKSLGEHVNQIPASDVTVSLFREDFPRGLFRELEKQHSVIEQKFPGIYYISGAGTLFDTQIVVTSELRKEGHSSLRILSRDVNEEDILHFMTESKDSSSVGEKYNRSAVLTVSTAANVEIYKKIMEENDMTTSVLEELLADKIKEQYSSGLNIGMQRGMERGLEQGLEQGRQMVYSLVQNGYITPEVGAMQLNITVEQLRANMINTGYKYPETK